MPKTLYFFIQFTYYI